MGINLQAQRADPRSAIRAKHTEMINSDDIHVVTVGTGNPMLVEGRMNGCTAVMGGGVCYLVDTGPGSARNLVLEPFDISQVNGVMMTHFHSDHIGDLGEMCLQGWIMGRREPLQVYGPPGLEKVVNGMTEVYEQDCVYREEHHTKKLMNRKYGKMEAIVLKDFEEEDGQTFLQQEKNGKGMKVTIFPVDHGPVKPASGFRFELNGKVVVVSGDTTKCDSLVKHAMNCDLLVQEVICCQVIHNVREAINKRDTPQTARLSAMLEDTLDYHSHFEDCTKICEESNAKSIVFTHIVPPVPDPLVGWVFRKSSNHGGPKVPNWFATDMDHYVVHTAGQPAAKIPRILKAGDKARRLFAILIFVFAFWLGHKMSGLVS